MDDQVIQYPYKLYITGTASFNNYFLFRHYLNEYITNKSLLYSPKDTIVDCMSKLYATENNLCHLTCNIAKGLERYHDAKKLNSVISNTADMLLAFWDGKANDINDLIQAFKSRCKKVILIDITDKDNITDNIVSDIPYTTKATFRDVFGRTVFYQCRPRSKAHVESAMQFLADAYSDRDFLKLVIDNRTTDFIVNDSFDIALKALLTWIYNNQFDELKLDYENMFKKEEVTPFDQSDVRVYRKAAECRWDEDGEEVEVYTGTGLLLSTGYTSIIDYDKNSYIEINDTQLIKSHIHKSLITHMWTEDEDDCVKVVYRTSDVESYPITYQVANFENSKFKMGYWYINANYVTTVKPNPKKEVTFDET